MRGEKPEIYLAVLMRQAGIAPSTIMDVFGWDAHYTCVKIGRAAKRLGIAMPPLPREPTMYSVAVENKDMIFGWLADGESVVSIAKHLDITVGPLYLMLKHNGVTFKR